MSHILVLGGGIAGCAAALELARRGCGVTLLEKEDEIGGKVRAYGCKAAQSCQNCGVCLSGGLWDAVLKHPGIRVITGAHLVDITGTAGCFRAVAEGPRGRVVLEGISRVLAAVGFEAAGERSLANLELPSREGVITGTQLERLLSRRASGNLLPGAPRSVAFLSCFGSRDVKEKALYCSRVCCVYAARAARALKHACPDIEITFFYMDLQRVENGPDYEEMARQGFAYLRTRPVQIEGGRPAAVRYEDPATGGVRRQEFDLVVLAEGIHPPADAEQLSELLGLDLDARGFLACVQDSARTGVYLAGCAGGPKRIEEVYAEALAVAGRIADSLEQEVAI